MPRTVEAVASELERERELRLSERQFLVLCSLLRRAGDLEAESRRLAQMRREELIGLIGERNL